MASVLITTEAQCAERLLSNPYFANIQVLVDPQKNVVQLVAQQIAKVGMVVAPLINQARVENPNQGGPVFEPLKVEVGVFQNPVFGANYPAPREVAEEVCSTRGLHLFEPANLSARMVCLGFDQVADTTLNIFSCHFEVKAGIGNPVNLPQVAPVTWDGTQFSCATAGAAIFYTTDGRHPAPRNGTLALGAVGLGRGLAIKARAWLAGYEASEILKFTT